MFDAYLKMLAAAGLGQCIALALGSTAIWYAVYHLAEAIGGDSVSFLPGGGWDDVASWLLL